MAQRKGSNEPYSVTYNLASEKASRSSSRRSSKEEMTEHLKAGYRKLTPTHKGERNVCYQRNLITPAGKIERLEVPRDQEGELVTEV